MRLLGVTLICLASLGMSAEDVPQIPDTKKYFEWFMNEGINSPNLSDEDARRIISVGIRSEKSEVVSLTVFTLALFSFGHELKGYPDFQPSQPALDRDSLQVPGLKTFLINYWRTQTTGMDDDPRYPSWELVPRALAFIFPRDADVLDVIWEIAATKQDRTYDLQLMNLGKFNTPEVNRHRIESLFIEHNRRGEAHLKMAAWGLAEHQPPEGLAALVHRQDEPHEDLHWVLDAISAYEIKALPYLNQLRSLKSKMEDLPYSDKFKERLDTLLTTLKELDATDHF